MNNENTNTTAATNDDVISTLNNLIETCKDGQNGFQTAAEGVQNSNLKSTFYEFGQQRAKFVGELQALVRELGGDPANSGSVAASLHRGWINIKSTITGQDDATSPKTLTKKRWKCPCRQMFRLLFSDNIRMSNWLTIQCEIYATRLTTKQHRLLPAINFQLKEQIKKRLFSSLFFICDNFLKICLFPASNRS
jgi:hypothetical protein